MPCKKCDEGKYKWGETGECEYNSLKDCESANHKYNKMQPTPLGKKSYEEYEKELKEYNLSLAYRVELGLLDDLDTLEDKSFSLVRDINSAYDDYSYYRTGEDDIVDDIENVAEDVESWQSDLDDGNKKVKELEEDKVVLLKGLKSWQEEVKLAKGNIKDLNAQLKKRNSDLIKFRKERDNTLKKYKKLESEGDKLASKLKKNIGDFKSAAGSLGVRVNTSGYESALNSLEAAGGSI